MKFVVRVGEKEFIGEGANYIIQGNSYVLFVSSINRARRYKTKALAERASKRKGENMYESTKIIEVKE